MPRKKICPEFVTVPVRPGLYIKFYHGTQQGFEDFVIGALGCEMRRVPGSPIAAWGGVLWYGPIPPAPKEEKTSA